MRGGLVKEDIGVVGHAWCLADTTFIAQRETPSKSKAGRRAGFYEKKAMPGQSHYDRHDSGGGLPPAPKVRGKFSPGVSPVG